MYSRFKKALAVVLSLTILASTPVIAWHINWAVLVYACPGDKCKELKEQLAEAQRVQAQRQAEYDAAQQAAAENRAKLEKARRDLVQVNAEIQRLEDELRQVKQEKGNAITELADVRKKLSDLRTKIQELKKEIEQLELKIGKIDNDIYWIDRQRTGVWTILGLFGTILGLIAAPVVAAILPESTIAWLSALLGCPIATLSGAALWDKLYEYLDLSEEKKQKLLDEKAELLHKLYHRKEDLEKAEAEEAMLVIREAGLLAKIQRLTLREAELSSSLADLYQRRDELEQLIDVLTALQQSLDAAEAAAKAALEAAAARVVALIAALAACLAGS